MYLSSVLVTLVTVTFVRCQNPVSVAFMNITTDFGETGFYQIYCISNNPATIKLQPSSSLDLSAATANLNSFQQLSSSQAFFNGTYEFSTLKIVKDTIRQGITTYTDSSGITIASSTSNVDCYGVKSDKGTTDGFYALPVTTNSTEFFIASWPCIGQFATFFSGLQIISVFEDTCVNAFTISAKGVYSPAGSRYFATAYQVYLYVANCANNSGVFFDGDVTGIYVNSSRPISVIAGQSCAFIPNNETYFCDYIAEQIPPVSELGTDHVVPPILGRNTDVGYVVRVVATEDLRVSWSSPDGKTNVGSANVSIGQFQQIETFVTNVPLLIRCTAKCLVMQYNKGRTASKTPDTPTDPMMMNIAPNDHFGQSGCFATANFDRDYLITVNFNNFVSIITTTDGTSSILFDGLPVTASWTSTPWGYSYTAFSISHGGHCISVKPKSNAAFGAYSYGHSLDVDSSSAYGYTISYKVHGTLVQEPWQTALNDRAKLSAQVLNVSCGQEQVYNGSAVSTYLVPGNLQTVKFPFALQATVSSQPMLPGCLNSYKQSLVGSFLQVSRLINFLICNHTMCPSLTGSPSSGVSLNNSTWLFNHVLYAAIDTAALDSAVQIDVNFAGSITAIHVTVPYNGILDTTSDSFTSCQAEVRKFLIPFANWPLGNSLLPTIPGCPLVTTFPPFQFVPSIAGVCP